MQTDLIAVLCGLAAGIGWGISGFFDAKSSRSIGPLAASLLINGIVAVGYAVVYALFLHDNYPVSASGVWFAIASGMVITIGALMYFRGLALGPVSLVSPLSASYPLVTTLFAVVVFAASLSVVQLGAIGMIMAGVMAATGLFTAKGVNVHKIQRGPAFAIVTALTWGLGYALASQAIERLGWQLASLLEFIAMAVAFGLFLPLIKTEKQVDLQAVKTGIKNKFVLIAGFVSLFAAVILNIGLSREQSSGAIVATLSACYPVLTVLLARRHFDEQVGLIPLSGAFVSIAGVIILSIG